MKKIMWQAGIFLFCCLLFSGCGTPNNARVTGGTFMKSAKKLYQEYVPGMEEALEAYREERGFTVDYAVYDRYCYFDEFYLPGGLITILSEDNDVKGFSMTIHCCGRFYQGGYCAGPDSNVYLCEYYEMDGFHYFSYTDAEGNGMALFPGFMCMEEMENLREVNSYDTDYNIYHLKKENSDEKLSKILETEIPAREYLEADGVLYLIDRKKEALIAVEKPDTLLSSGTPAKTDFVYESWLLNQKALCQNFLYEKTVSEEEVNALLSAGYALYDYTVADMNGDGIPDVLTVIYPVLEQYENRNSYADDSPYCHILSYYYLELWMFSGQKDGSYKGERLMDSDFVVDDDVLTLVDITGFDGGFYMEYFVGRSPHETKLKKYVYSDENWNLTRWYRNDTRIYPQSISIYNDVSEANIYPVSIGDYVNETYGYLLCQSYCGNNIFYVADEALASRITENLIEETDKLFTAIEKLDECHDVLLFSNVAYISSSILVFEFEVSDRTDEDIFVGRMIPVTIDLNTGAIIDYRDYITSEDLAGLLACESSECPSRKDISRGLFEKYDDYETLLKAGSPSMTVLVTHEGLCLMNTDEYWMSCCLIPKSRLIDSPLSGLWDDWP